MSRSNHYGLGNVIVKNEEPSIYADCEELVKILVHRCKKLVMSIRELESVIAAEGGSPRS
jgi:hypothetical protein